MARAHGSASSHPPPLLFYGIRNVACVTGYPKGARIADENGHELVSGGEYRLEGDVIQFFDIADKYLQ